MNAFCKTWPITPVAFTLSAVILFCLVVYLSRWEGNDYYEAAFLDKERLLQNVPSPRIILVGGSNVAFCFDSNVIRQAMHENVVNTGLHIGFGVRCTLNMLNKYARAGDLIVICPEYEEFFGLFGGNENLVRFLISYPHVFSYVSLDEAVPLFLGGRTLLNRKCVGALTEQRNKIFPPEKKEFQSSKAGQIYRRSAFNADGDIAVVLDKTEKSDSGFWLPLYINARNRFDEGVIPALNEFAASMSKRGVKVVFTYPYLSESFYNACWPGLQMLEARLKSQLKMPIVGSVSHCVMPEDHFFDTRYHILTRYKEGRTSSILPGLRLIETNPGYAN